MAQNTRTPPAFASKPRYRVTNWRAYNRALISRGSITLWTFEEVIAGWRATGGKGLRYSDVAMRAALSLRAVFRLPLRQTQGFLLSLKRLLGLAIDIPHYSTFCRRARSLDVAKPARPAGDGPLHLAIDATGLKVHGEGEWKTRTHGKDRRRVWRKLHLGVDLEPGEIAAQALTPSETHDGTELQGLLAQVERPITAVCADKAYDSFDSHRGILARQAQPVIPRARAPRYARRPTGRMFRPPAALPSPASQRSAARPGSRRPATTDARSPRRRWPAPRRSSGPA